MDIQKLIANASIYVHTLRYYKTYTCTIIERIYRENTTLCGNLMQNYSSDASKVVF